MILILSIVYNHIFRGSKGWHYQIYLEHNVYHIILNLNDCNKFEKYV
jgi:hypothetical protein